MGKQWIQWQTLLFYLFIYFGSKITADGDWSHEIKRRLLLGRKVMINLDSILKSRDITLPTKVYLVKATVFPVVMYGCESWTIKKAEHQRSDAFELWCWRRLESPLDCKEMEPVNPKGNQSWVFIGRTDAETEAPIFWPSDVNSWLIWKDPDAGKDWRQEEKGTTEDEMVGWHHRLMDVSLGKLQEFAQTHVHWVSETIQPSLSLQPPSPPALNFFQDQGLFQWVSCSHQVAKILELQFQHQSFQWIFRVELL